MIRNYYRVLIIILILITFTSTQQNSKRLTDVFPYAAQLCQLIRQHNPLAEPMFYMTWGRQNGDASNCVVWPAVFTYQGIDSLLQLRYG